MCQATGTSTAEWLQCGGPPLDSELVFAIGMLVIEQHGLLAEAPPKGSHYHVQEFTAR